MADQLESTDSKSENVVFSISRRQLDKAFNNEKWSDVTLVSEDGEKFYARWNILALQWMWLSGRRNVEQARNVNEGDNNAILIQIPGKMLFAILKWTYYKSLDLTGWSFDELRLFTEKCDEFELPDLEERAKVEVKNMTIKGNVKSSDIGQIFEYARKVEDKVLMDTVVRLARDRVEEVASTTEFGHFSPELVAKMAGVVSKDKYIIFLRSIPLWSKIRSSEELAVVMKSVKWSIVPNELIGALVSAQNAWNSEEVAKLMENLETFENRNNEYALEKENLRKVDHVPRSHGSYILYSLLLTMLIVNVSLWSLLLTLPAQLPSTVEFFEPLTNSSEITSDVATFKEEFVAHCVGEQCSEPNQPLSTVEVFESRDSSLKIPKEEDILEGEEVDVAECELEQCSKPSQLSSDAPILPLPTTPSKISKDADIPDHSALQCASKIMFLLLAISLLLPYAICKLNNF